MPQPTKLKKPITITLTHIENAILLLIIGKNRIAHGREERLANNCMPGRENTVIEHELSAQGIDYRTWEPPQPFKIGAHETTFNPNGSIKVGCTEIERATLEEVLKRSDQAMQKGDEWPRYFAYNGSCNKTAVWRCDSEVQSTELHRDGQEIQSGLKSFQWGQLENEAAEGFRKRLTRAEACAILGREA